MTAVVQVPDSGHPTISLDPAPDPDQHDVTIDLPGQPPLVLRGDLADLYALFELGADMLGSFVSNAGRPDEGTGPAQESRTSGDPAAYCPIHSPLPCYQGVL